MKNVNIICDGSKRNKEFERICCKSQPELKEYLKKKLVDSGREVIEEPGYLFSEGSLAILVCAHLDTVHKELPKEIVYKSGTISSPQGIGGDDRCGVYMILQILKELDVSVAFFEDEEIGGVGSSKFAKSKHCWLLKDQIQYVIELDRKGNRDAVFYDCANYEFIDFVTQKFWKEAFGSFTDICHICPELNAAGVNLSCGYYKAHTTDEYVNLKEMETAIRETINLINIKTEEFFEYVEYKKPAYYAYSDKYLPFSDYNAYDNYLKEDEYLILYDNNGEEFEETYYAVSEAEALGLFFMDHPTMTMNDVLSYGML